jgi:hypothetical protein
MDWQKVIFDGTVYAIICSLLVMFSLWRMPRIWLQDFPEDIQAKVPPKTEQEKKLSLIIGIPFLLLLFAGPFLSGLTWKLNTASSIPFLSLLLHVFLIAMFFNVVDWLILDWLIVCTITPKFLVYPGTEGVKGYKDYKFHFIGFLKGSVISLVTSLVITLLILIF